MFGAISTRGRWRGSSSRSPRYFHSNQSHTTRPCRYFRNGSCRYGSECDFSHDQAIADAGLKLLGSSGDLSSEGYNDWKCLMRTKPLGYSTAKSLILREVWSTALQILDDNSRESHQRLIKDLVDDQLIGGEYLLHTLQMKFVPLGKLELDLVDKFLRTITHEAILNCLSVDTYVGTLYNMVSGASGGRAVEFFSNLTQAILIALDSECQPNHTDIERYYRHSNLMVDTMHQLFMREKRVSFNEELPKLLDQLDRVYEIFGGATDLSALVEVPEQDGVGVLRRIVRLTTRTLEDTGKATTQWLPSVLSSFKPTNSLVFQMEMSVPGDRHDNDHTDIASISIIPTASELASDQADYLPSSDFRQPHFLMDPVQRHIDTHFRLLRHDIFGSLRQAVRPLLQSTDAYLAISNRPPGRDVNAHFYSGALLSHVSVHEKRGFEVCVTFRLPNLLRAKTAGERRQWWTNSKRLEPGNLACLVHPDKGKALALLLIVVDKHSEDKDRRDWRPDSSVVSITAKLANVREADLQQAIGIYRKRTEGTLLGFPSLLPATFTPILENMKKMVRSPELPFREWVIPGPQDERGRASRVCPSVPLYARQHGFLFPLEPIVTGSDKSLYISAEASPEDSELLGQLEAETDLDRGQCSALIAALTREYALIQGPPGTGKSYLGVKLIQILLSCKEKAALGPIIIIFHTNHALDQFLSHLLHAGVKKFIRIGGQSRNPELDGFNLRAVCERAPKTGIENYIVGSTYTELDRVRQAAGKRLATLHKMRKESQEEVLKRFLQIRYPGVYCQIYSDHTDGWRLVRSKLDPLLSWMGMPSWRDQSEDPSNTLDPGAVDALCAKAEDDIKALSGAERRALVNHWTHQVQTEQVQRLLLDIEQAEKLREQVDQVHSEVRRRTLLTADIIGMTTTGLAKEISVIRNLQSKVVVAEEAAEVHEAHMLSALMPGVEHFIQIGDHQQLRPQINNYDLSLESSSGRMFQLDRSQFERLAVGEPGLPAIPVAQLDVQRRMRPEIARLVRDTMYPGLRDHESVVNFCDVSGMRDNVFWLNHSHGEDSENDHHHVKSRSNEWEVDMTMALIHHLVRQGCYKSTDIAVLTPYSGQLVKLRTCLGNDFDIALSDRDEDVLAREGFEIQGDRNSVSPLPRLHKKRLSESLRLATVDNFQGEEAKVVVVSLVRSNHVGKVGFLKTKNRINVLLSRAQHGLYLIGNADTYSNVPMWVDIRRQLEETDSVGPAFRLCCPRHQDTPIECAEPEDFPRLSPEGGCSLTCGWRLQNCGHQCLAKCHSEAMHSVFLCPRPCPRRHKTCNHPCPKLCGEDCGLCEVILDDVQLPCGHSLQAVACFRTQQLADIKCSVEVRKEVPGCGHVLSLPCHRDTTSPAFKCSEPCPTILECGHSCAGSCGKCHDRGSDGSNTATHQTCRKLCGRPHNTCSHVCVKTCHPEQPCPPCLKPCEVRCSHSRCALSCRDVCAPCIEQCTWACEHQGACTMPCAAPCNRLPCDERCQSILPCGHQCPGLCGEHCPQGYCQACGEKSNDRVDLLEFKSYKDIDLDDAPIVVLGCGHFFTAESLDGLAGLGEVYTTDKHGQYAGLDEPAVVLPIPNCPDCKVPIRQFATQRYNRVVNAGVMDETTKRYLVKGQRDLENLEQCIREAERKLEPSWDRKRPASRVLTPPSEVQRTQETRLRHRYEKLEDLEIQAVKLRRAVDVELQPCKKLFDAILEAETRERSSTYTSDTMINVLPNAAPEWRLIFAVSLAELRIRAIMLRDKILLHEKASVVLTNGTQLLKASRSLLHDCETLFKETSENKLPKYTVMCALTHAKMASTLQRSRLLQSEGEKSCVETSKVLLEKSKTLCEMPFHSAAELAVEVDVAQQQLRSERYETVTADEIKLIKIAMVSGSGGMRTHSGHWYKCQNGHAFAIGECGMPMEEARCPECGSRIGGRNHQLLSTVTRAEEMEN